MYKKFRRKYSYGKSNMLGIIYSCFHSILHILFMHANLWIFSFGKFAAIVHSIKIVCPLLLYIVISIFTIQSTLNLYAICLAVLNIY